MPLLEQYYFTDPPVFATNLIDPRNNALVSGSEDTVTIRLTICAQSIIPLYTDGLPNGVGQPGAKLETKYRPCDTVRAVGYNTEKGYAISGSPLLPKPPDLAVTPDPIDIDGDLAAPMVVFIEPDGDIQIGSFDFFSAFFEPCSVVIQYIACQPPETENPPPPPPGGGGAAGLAMKGVVRLDGR